MGNSSHRFLHGGSSVFATVLRNLPTNMPATVKYELAFNAELVARGVRTATLVESADFKSMSLYRAATAVLAQLHHPACATRERAMGLHPQFLFYNTTRVTAQDVRDAVDREENAAMGRVLGFQCAGQHDAEGPKVTLSFFLHAPALDAPVQFFAEICLRDRFDPDRAERQTAQFQQVAQSLGLTVTMSFALSVLPTPVLQDMIMLEGVRADTHANALEAAVEHLLNANMLDLAKHITRVKKVRWPFIAGVLGIFGDKDVLLEVYKSNDNTITTALADAIDALTKRMTPLLYMDAHNPLSKAKPVVRIAGLTDVLVAVVHKQYTLLNEQKRAVEEMLQPTRLRPFAEFLAAHAALTPAQWDYVYVFVLAILKYRLFELAPREGYTPLLAQEVQVMDERASDYLG